MKRLTLVCGLAAAILAAAPARATAQQINAPAVVPRSKSYVTFTAEPQTVTAGKRSILELRFRVMDGFHVNSHTPKSELLIPTQMMLQSAPGVTAGALEYPAGTSYSFSFDPKEKLDVYSGVFTVRLPVIAGAGDHTLDATLNYQACDHAACYPPKSLPMQIVFTAR